MQSNSINEKINTAEVVKIGIVGNPNVGKSLVFNKLTGAHAVVSNYPGTTVDVTRGKMRINGREVEVVDTPGMYSLLPITEEERVARHVLLTEKPDVILQVTDAKNLERMLALTIQLIEAELPLVLQLNMMDEAKAAGVDINVGLLENELAIPVVGTVATTGRGMIELRSRLAAGSPHHDRQFKYDDVIESAVNVTGSLLTGTYGLSPRAIGLLLLQGDPEIESRVQKQEPEYESIKKQIDEVRTNYSQPLSYVISLARQQEIRRILDRVLTSTGKTRPRFTEGLSRAMMHPVSGALILILFLYFGLYQFVGRLGAGIIVGFFEKTVFGQYINPWATHLVHSLIPWAALQSLLVGQYGVITLGLTYAFALILPIVATFFIMFSIIEDSGYLPRLAMLIDRLFKTIGLSGRAVIPLVVGFGCDTMATVVTRTQETKRERVLTTLLLALAIPCSAQLGVIFAMLSGNTKALFIWIVVVVLTFILVGFLASRVLPGERASFYMEIPPLRLPRIGNVISKTLSRMQWYFMEVMPIFILVSVLLWAGDLTGVLAYIGRGLQPVVAWIGLPPETGPVFLYGFFRRDFGAAGLYALKTSGILTGIPLVVSAVTLTLFVPCVAQFMVMMKERGVKTAIAIALFIFPFAFLVGFILNWTLKTLGVVL
jgi:ferrous iron transport protein B